MKNSNATKEINYCPFHKGPIIRPCKLKKCDLWINSHKYKCILYALKSTRTGATKAEVLSNVFKLNKEEITHILNKAYDILKIRSIQQSAKSGYIFGARRGRCIVCGRKRGQYIEINGIKWCSNKCMTWLPYHAVLLENKFGYCLRDILFNWQNLKLTALARTTGLKKDQIVDLLWQHIGKRTKTVNIKKLRRPPDLISKKELITRIKLSKLWHDTL